MNNTSIQMIKLLSQSTVEDANGRVFHFAWVYILPSGDVAELIFDWIHGSQLKGNRKPGWAVNKEDFHKQIGNYCKVK